MLLVLGYRTEDGARSACVQLMQGAVPPSRADIREIRVGPLLTGEAQSLARALLPPPDAALASRIAREADGNPLFVAELARHPSPDRVTLEEMLLARVAQLPPSARRLLEVIAVAGKPIEWSRCRCCAPLVWCAPVARVSRSKRTTTGSARR